MEVVIGNDKKGFELKEKVEKYLEGGGYEVLDVTPEPAKDFIESSSKITHEVLDHGIEKVTMFDECGVGSTMASNKVKGMVTVGVNEERTEHMTAMYDGVKALVIGSGTAGEKLAESIIDYYLHTEYVGGRHQVRLDMLEKMI